VSTEKASNSAEKPRFELVAETTAPSFAAYLDNHALKVAGSRDLIGDAIAAIHAKRRAADPNYKRSAVTLDELLASVPDGNGRLIVASALAQLLVHFAGTMR
jgi:hypothetical protein